jgi:SRSO17 transposase
MSRPEQVVAWKRELEQWCAPFLEPLGRAEQRAWAPVYLCGLLGPGERKSIEPMAERVARGKSQSLHHFVSVSPWEPAPLEAALVKKAQALVGGPRAVLIVDDTALVKQGQHSVGVAHQYCGELGKKANCQVLVSLTLARGEVPAPIALRLFLPEVWASDPERRHRAGVPAEVTFRPKWSIALDEIDRVRAQGAIFGCVLADAGYGNSADFRQGLSERGLRWAVGILPTQKVYSADVRLVAPVKPPTGRPQKHPTPSETSRAAHEVIDSLPEDAWQRIAWRRGTKGELKAHFVAVRVRVADGPLMSRAQHLPGEDAWLICERRSSGERKYYLANQAGRISLQTLAHRIHSRWSCEQAHMQMKQELGLDHFEGRSWRGLHRHALLSMVAFCFLQHLRLGGENPAEATPTHRPAPNSFAAAGTPGSARNPAHSTADVPVLSARDPLPSLRVT